MSFICLARRASLIVVCALTVFTAAACAFPFRNAPASEDTDPPPAMSSLTIRLSSAAAMPAGLISFYPPSAYVKLNGSGFSFNGLSNSVSTKEADQGTSAAVVYSVNAAAEGRYRIRFLYAFGGTETNLRDAWIIVNGQKATVDSDEILEFAYVDSVSGKWAAYGYTDYVQVPLIAGDNEIRLTAVNTPGYSRSIVFTRTGSGGTAGETGTGYVSGLANVAAMEVSGYSSLAPGTGSTALYTLAAPVIGGSGAVSVSPKQEYYLPGSAIALTADPEPGFVFDSWEGSASSRDNPLTLELAGDSVITARFVPRGARSPGDLMGFASVQDDAGTAYTLTGGFGASSVTEVASLTELRSALAGTGPLLIRVAGLIDNGANPSVSLNVPSDTTLFGDPTNVGRLRNIELKISGENVIVRNLVISEVVATATADPIAEGSGNDGINIAGGKHIWIDHCEFFSRLAPENCPDFSNASESGSDGAVDQYDYKDFYDGQIDVSDAARWITVSNCFFHDHWKSLLWGDSDTDASDAAMRITLANNYFKDIRGRLPKLRFGKAHAVNNYFLGIAGQTNGADASANATLFLEGNYFKDMKYPAFVMQSPGYFRLKDNLVSGCVYGLPSGSVNWNPGYSYTPKSAAAVAAGNPESWTGAILSAVDLP